MPLNIGVFPVFGGTTKSEGSGFGLFIVKDIAEKLKVEIIRRGPSEGPTRFTLMLPHEENLMAH